MPPSRRNHSRSLLSESRDQTSSSCSLASLVAAAPPSRSITSAPKCAQFIDEMTRDHGFDRERTGEAAGAGGDQAVDPRCHQPPGRTRRALVRVSRTLPHREAHPCRARSSGARTRSARSHRRRRHRRRRSPAFSVSKPPTVASPVATACIDALATLAFDYPPRGEFFRGELQQFLMLSREEAVDPTTALGSYAGAMGAPQFISSSYRNFAVDADGDGHRDLWSSWDDVIGSVANYLRVHGWRDGEPVVVACDARRRGPDALRHDRRSSSTKPCSRCATRACASKPTLAGGCAGDADRRAGQGRAGVPRRLQQLLRHHALQPQHDVRDGSA